MQFIITRATVLLTLVSLSVHSAPPKKQLLQVYANERRTFFCEHPFSDLGILQPTSLGFQPIVTENVQWMPIVPLNQIAKHYACYQQKCVDKKGKIHQGLRCCQQHDQSFQRMANDLHNFVPETRLLKQLRARTTFTEFSSLSNLKTTCGWVFDEKQKRLEPPPNKRGEIARTYLYMKERYPFILTQTETELYWRWHQRYPVTPFEKERNEKIFSLQGQRNPYVG